MSETIKIPYQKPKYVSGSITKNYKVKKPHLLSHPSASWLIKGIVEIPLKLH